MAIKYVPGKVYLRDTRNGTEYEYEANLAANKNMISFVGVPHTKKTEKDAVKEAEAKAAEIQAAAEARAQAEADAAARGPEPARAEVVAAVETNRADEPAPVISEVHPDPLRADNTSPTPATVAERPAVPAPPAPKPVTPVHVHKPVTKSVARKAPARKTTR